MCVRAHCRRAYMMHANHGARTIAEPQTNALASVCAPKAPCHQRQVVDHLVQCEAGGEATHWPAIKDHRQQPWTCSLLVHVQGVVATLIAAALAPVEAAVDLLNQLVAVAHARSSAERSALLEKHGDPDWYVP